MIIYPISYEVIKTNKSLLLKNSMIFIGGPIKGAPGWQFEAIRYMENRTQAHIASPRHPDLTEDECLKLDIPWRQYSHEEQVQWELAHMQYSFAEGCIMFWFPKEQTHDCQYHYAQTSRFELGYFLGRGIYTTGSVVIGIEDGFPNEEYLRFNIPRLYPYIEQSRIYSTLEEACDKALAIANVQ